MDRIDILLATYNGAAFLGEQLDSIEAQTHENWRLIARDDGSTDGTLEILKNFYGRHPNKVSIELTAVNRRNAPACFPSHHRGRAQKSIKTVFGFCLWLGSGRDQFQSLTPHEG